MRSHPILDVSANLVGVSLIIVTAVHITGKAARTFADEVSFAAALLFIGACVASHRSISKSDDRFEKIGDRIFVTGLVVLLVGVLSFWM
jgi:hypothetical protein